MCGLKISLYNFDTEFKRFNRPACVSHTLYVLIMTTDKDAYQLDIKLKYE